LAATRRIEVSPAGERLLVVGDAGITVRDARAPHAVQATLARRVLDACWRSDASIAVVAGAAIEHLSLELVVELTVPLEAQRSYRDVPIARASFGRGGIGFVADQWRGAVYDASGQRTWTADYTTYNGELQGFALSDDGKRVALGYVVGPLRGRGWLVADVKSGKILDRKLDQFPEATKRPMSFAFDRTGKRMIRAWPDAVPDGGAIRIDRGEVYARPRPGGAIACALDDRGVIAVYAYPVAPTGQRGRLRIEYLDADAKGPVDVAVTSVLAIEPDLGDLAAIAVSPDRRSIACAASDGTVEIVPVP